MSAVEASRLAPSSPVSNHRQPAWGSETDKQVIAAASTAAASAGGDLRSEMPQALHRARLNGRRKRLGLAAVAIGVPVMMVLGVAVVRFGLAAMESLWHSDAWHRGYDVTTSTWLVNESGPLQDTTDQIWRAECALLLSATGVALSGADARDAVDGCAAAVHDYQQAHVVTDASDTSPATASAGSGSSSDPDPTNADSTTADPQPSDSVEQVAPDPTTVDPAAQGAQVGDTADGLVTADPDVTSSADGDVVTAIASTLDGYMSGVNARDFKAAYAYFSADSQRRTAYGSWRRGVASSTISEVRLIAVTGSVAGVANGPVSADVAFTSHQPGNLGPSAGEKCTQWALTYTLVPDSDATGYRIDAAQPTEGSGHQAC